MKINLRRFYQPFPGVCSVGQSWHTGLLALCVAVPVMLPLSPLVSAADEGGRLAAGKTVVEPVEEDDVEALVVQLGDEAYLVRKKASEALWKCGADALPALRRAMGGKDPEVVHRASELFLYISSGVLFDSPEEIKALVLKFSRSQVAGKMVILRKLMELGQWKQVLHLARFEKQPEARAKMSDIVKQAAGRATRDALAKGDFELAADILELASDDPQSMLLRAWLYTRRGQFDEQLKKAADMPGKKGAIWRLALYRTHGDIPAAIREADKAGEGKLADALRILSGDPAPWLRRNSRQSNFDIIYHMGSRIQLDRLAGKEKQASVIARELAQQARNVESTARVANCLAANGFRKEAVDLLRRHDVEAAFDYFDSMESPKDCLAVLGIPEDAKAPYTDWVKKFTDDAFENEDDGLYHQLVLLASFLVSRGEGQHAVSVLTPIMSALEEDGSDDWFELISSMGVYGLGAEAIHFIEQRGNEDGEADLAVKKLVRQMPSKSLNHIWEHLKKRNNQDVGKALRQLGLLSGLLADPENETDKLHKVLIDEVDAADPEVKDARMSALFSFSVKRNDLATAARMSKTLAAVSDEWIRSKTYLDAALLRWEDVEPHLAAIVEKNPGDYLSMMKWHIALSKLGRDQKAEEVYRQALLLSMGSAEVLNRFGWQLHEVGYEQKAVDLWLQAAVMGNAGESEFDRSMIYLANYGQALYRGEKWKLAASISEISAQLMMRGRRGGSVNAILRTRFYAEFCQGMDLLKKGKKSEALKKLDAARQLIPGDGLLADEFFPVLRKANIGKYYDQWFEDSYRHVAAACKLYPKAHNSHNTAAWLAARAVRKLDEALVHSEAAIKIRPNQGAYLDTMAEVWFAKGNRAKAIEWSERAVAGSIANAQGNPRRESLVIANYKQLYKQLERYRHGPLPRPGGER